MAGGLALHDSGSGPAVLFLHAFPLDASQWDRQVAALSGGHRCLRPDMWGGADSPPPPGGEPSLDIVAGALVEALAERGVRRTVVVGSSMGGYIALALLRRAPELVTALALCSTRATADPDTVRRERLASAERVEREQSVEWMVEPNVERLLGERARSEVHITDPLRGRIRRWTPAGIAYALRAMAARPDSTALLPAIKVPALVIAGDADALIPAEDTHALAAGIPGCRVVHLQCGHLPNLELPHDFTDALAAFLDDVSG